MNNFKLRLKGFIGIKRGLGLDEITIDFSTVSGLTAFDGMNGAGKSTVLENLHPYSTLASRFGALYQHVFLRNSEKEFSFSYNGNHYRTLLKIDSQSGKSEGFIYKNAATKSETTGKIREYDKYIVNLLGTELMFFHSVFCAQNAMKLSDMTTGELKTLLSEFLNLDKLAGWEADSKEKITAVTGQLEQVDKQLLILNNKLAGFNDSSTMLAKNKEELTTCEASIEILKKKRVEYQAELEQLRDRKAKQEVLLSQKVNIEAKIIELNNTLAKEQADSNAELNKLRDAYKALQAQIKDNETLLQQADEINTAAEKEKSFQESIDRLTKDIETLTEEQTSYQLLLNGSMADLSCVQGALKDFEKEISNIKNDPEIATLSQSITHYTLQMDTLNIRDQNCQSSSCKFIVDALKAKEELPRLKEAFEEKKRGNDKATVDFNVFIAAAKDERIALEDKIAGFKKEIERISGINSDGRKLLAKYRFDLTKVKELAGKKTALEVAKSQYDSITKQMEDNALRGKELKVKWENRKSDLDGSIKDAQVSLAELEQRIDSNINELIKNNEKNAQVLERSISDSEKNINTTRANIMKLEAELASMASVEKELKAANDEKSRLQQDIADWTYLKNACGKNGLQAMEIDGAAPIITNFANDLLTQAFGPLFTVKFRTINDEGKECLDIIVISDDGEEILLDNLSGGQRVWILMALRLAMTLLSKEKSGRNFETFYADELDGALDPENALNFVNMYRSFMTMGGFKDGYFISHKPSCRGLADNNLMFAPGNNPTWQ